MQHDSAASRLPQKHPVVHIIVLLSVENQIKYSGLSLEALCNKFCEKKRSIRSVSSAAKLPAANPSTIWGHKSTGCCWAGVYDEHHPRRTDGQTDMTNIIQDGQTDRRMDRRTDIYDEHHPRRTDGQTPHLLLYIR